MLPWLKLPSGPPHRLPAPVTLADGYMGVTSHLRILSSVSFTIVTPHSSFSQGENFTQFVHFHIAHISNTQHALYKYFLVTPACNFNTWKDEAGGLHEFQASLSYEAGTRPAKTSL